MYTVISVSESSFGQTEAGFHSATNARAVGHFASAAEALNAALAALTHGNRRAAAWRRLPSGLNKCVAHSDDAATDQAALIAAVEAGARLDVGTGSSQEVEVCLADLARPLGQTVDFDGQNLAWQKALLSGAA